MVMMVAEEAVTVGKEIPDNEDVEDQNPQHRPGELGPEAVNFDRNEKDRLANGQPARPTDAEDQPNPLDEREQAVGQHPGGKNDRVMLGDAGPFGVTIDFDTLGEKPELLNTVTLRDRDTTKQERVKIEDLVPLLVQKIR